MAEAECMREGGVAGELREVAADQFMRDLVGLYISY